MKKYFRIVLIYLLGLCCHVTAYPSANDIDSLNYYKNLIAIDSTNHNFNSAFEHLKKKEIIAKELFDIQKNNIINDNIERHSIETMRLQIDDMDEKLKKMEEKSHFRTKMTFAMAALICFILIIILIQIYLHENNRRVSSSILVENNQKQELLEGLMRLAQKYDAEIKQLSYSNDQFEMTNAVKDKLLSVISHDLRSPISSLQALLSLFNTNNIVRNDLIDFFGKLLSRVENTSSMLENLLHWSQYQLKGIEPIFERVNLQMIIDECINLYRMQAEQKHIVIDNSLKTDVHVYVDAEMLKVILRNLISNALKFTHSGGIITIMTMTKDDFAVISVKDTGVGISPENQVKMFAMNNFTTPGTEKEKGTGLGLALCKDFVEHNHGKIWLDSKLNAGATFYFSIPLAGD